MDTGSLRILVAEDNPDHCFLLTQRLRAACAAIRLETVDTGREVIERLGRHDYDCVILDFNLPDQPADEILRQISQLGIKCPIIVISSSEDQILVVRCVRNGSVDFVPKAEAFGGETLWHRIEVAVGRARREAGERRRIERRVQRLSRLAETDPLTGLTNRFGLDRFLKDRRQLIDRRGNVICLMADLDRFKSINDAWGHQGGDATLRSVAGILRSVAGDRDITCRYGGEEFLMVMPATPQSEAFQRAEALRRQIEAKAVEFDGSIIRTTISIGLSSGRPEQIRDSIVDADRALYLAKQTGRNRVCSAQMAWMADFVDEMTADGHESARQRVEAVFAACGEWPGANLLDATIDHSRRVGAMARELGSLLGLESDALERLETAGLLHDLGKLMMPPDLLGKPDPLAPDERELFRRFEDEGIGLAGMLGADEALLRSARDRRPGLNGDAVAGGDDLEAGILVVADVLDAISCDTFYHPARSTRTAMLLLLSGRGRPFHPDVVDVACGRLLRAAT